MKTFKVTFTNTSNKKDFFLTEAQDLGAAFEIGQKEVGIESMIGIDDVTNRFVDADGTITIGYYKR